MLKEPRLADVLFHAASPEPDEISTADEYEALTPSIIEPQESSTYTDALNFACSRGDIRNIAVTGAYGAGKSSVLRTWKECPDNDLRIMTVSLADFEMQSASRPKAEPADKQGNTSSADDKKAAAEEKTIEYSILQQLLYKEKKSSLPYSRIERITDISSFQVASVAADLLLILIVMLAGLLCLFPEYVSNKLSLPGMISQYLIDRTVGRLVLAGVLLFTALFLSVRKLHRIGLFDRRVSVDKIDMLKGAISTRPSSPSLLNVYIDEIVYFFEQTGHNVVIFEDLDRHNDGAIFIKLREINQIINNTRPDDEPVRFIYAVRDGLFSTAEARTKFFDFVIPVIPVMDSENAAEHFSSMFRETELGDPDFTKCVSSLALFIPDMRIMRNIANEFRIYQNLVNGAGDITRLLSMIAYKNIFAEDYHSIDEKKGVLYSFVRAFVSGGLKEEPVKERLEKIKKIQIEIDSLLSDDAGSVAEIRRSILSEYITPKQEPNFKFSFGVGEYFSLDALSQNEGLFNKLRSVNALYLYSGERGGNVFTINQAAIREIMTCYEDRKNALDKKTNGEVIQLRDDIDSLNDEINGLNQTSLVALARILGHDGFLKWVYVNDNADEPKPGTDKKRTEHLEFLYFLLSHSYIASDYMFYRSVFRPGSLSHGDNEFIKAVSIGRGLNYTLDMPLRQVENVAAKLFSLGLMMDANAWHPDVLLYLLENDLSKLHPIVQVQAADDWCLAQLAEHTFKKWSMPQRIRYVERIASTKEKAFAFVQRLSEMKASVAASELLLLQLCSSRLRWNHETTDMKRWARSILASNATFPDQVPEGYLSTFIRNVTDTRLYLSRLDVCESAEGRKIVRSIVDNGQWSYSADNLKNIFVMLTEDAETDREYLHNFPLSAIEGLNIPALKTLVWNNINNFIVDYFIKSQEHSRIPELLNNNSVIPERCFDIVTRMQFIIDEVSGIKNRSVMFDGAETKPEGNDLYSLLLEYYRVSTNWKQMSYLLHQEVFSVLTIAKWFDETHLAFKDTNILSHSSDSSYHLMQHFFNSPALSESSRKKILANLHVVFLSLPGNLPPEQVALMVEYGRLAPTAAVFTEIRDTYTDSDEGVSEILASLVSQYPALLTNHPLTVLVHDDEPDFPLAERLFSNDEVMKSAGISTLNWLWGYDPDVFEEQLFIPAESLRHIVPALKNDDLRLALLLQALSAGDLSHQIITLVLSSLSDDDYRVFLSTKAHRSVPYTKALIKMARLLEKAGFIQSLNVNEARQRIRFVPHCSSAFRHH
ncbi:pcar [Pantoea ananatis]|uniref:YobI family P-loop NTPase n=1 Tax=Pantoea ananas TaxID=553 RepID=UPI001B303EDE|nr:pcar [Pantoea ananatis]